MEQFNNQSPSELLTLLMDGELDDSSASVLFSSLASDSGLRNEMQDMIAIRESVRNDSEAFTPPPAVKQAVFNRLGFTGSDGGATVAPLPLPQSAFMASLGNFFSRYGVATVAAILLTSVSAYLIIDNTSNTDNINLIPVTSSIENSGSFETTNLKAFDAENYIADNSSLTSNEIGNQAPVRNINNNVTSVLTESDNAVQETNAVNNNEEAIADNDNSRGAQIESMMNASQPAFAANQIYRYSVNHGMNAASDSYSPLPIIVNNDAPKKITLQARGLIGESYSIGSNNQVNSALDAKTSFGVYLKSWGNLSIGFEVGSEAFAMEDRTAEYLNNTQGLIDPGFAPNRSVFWYGLGARYEINELEFLNVKPYGQALIGNSEHGMMGKGSLGLQWDVSNAFSLGAGVEGTLIRYQLNNQYNLEDKLGLTASVLLRM